MSQFVVKLNKGFKERSFLSKLNVRFKTISSKSILIGRSLVYFEDENNIYAVFKITPLIPNVPAYTSMLAFLLYGGIYAILDKPITFLWVGGVILLLMSFFWTKQFFYSMLKIVMKKNNITNSEMI